MGSGHEVLREVDDNSVLIVGGLCGILGMELMFYPIHLLNMKIILLNYNILLNLVYVITFSAYLLSLSMCVCVHHISMMHRHQSKCGIHILVLLYVHLRSLCNKLLARGGEWYSAFSSSQLVFPDVP